MTLELKTRRFTASEYHQMVEAGILTEDDRIELIDGEIIEMAPMGTRHLAYVNRLNRQFVRGLGDGVIVQVQGSIRLSEYSEPEPDLVLLHWRRDFYVDRYPGPEDVLLIVEVADSSLAYDRGVKAALYARSGIREYWLVDVNGRSITLYRDPSGDSYQSTSVAQGGDRLSLQAFPELVLTADEVFGEQG